jgi:hypothetical protein
MSHIVTPCTPSSLSSACTPSVVNTQFWYLDTTNNLVYGSKQVATTCPPNFSRTTNYFDRFGIPLVPEPEEIPVTYAVTATGANTNVNLSHAEQLCGDGQPVTRTTVWDNSVIPANVLEVIWQDINGAVITAPAVISADACLDTNKELGSYIVTMVGGAGVAQLVTPTTQYQGLTAVNISENWVRLKVTFTAATVTATAAATKVILIAPGGSGAVDFTRDPVTNSSTGTIQSFEVSPVTVPVVAGAVEVSTLALAAAALAGYVTINLASA